MLPTRMPDFHDLLGVQVPPLFERNGIPKPLGFWESYASKFAPLFGYIIPWESIDERMAAWQRFYTDPEWVEELVANYAGEQRVDRANVSILRALPMWHEFRSPLPATPVEGIHEMRIYAISDPKQVSGLSHLENFEIPFLIKKGAQVLGIFEAWIGMPRNRVITFLAWPDEETMQQAHYKLQEAKAHPLAEKPDLIPQFDEVDIHIMKPISYGLPMTNLSPTRYSGKLS